MADHDKPKSKTKNFTRFNSQACRSFLATDRRRMIWLALGTCVENDIQVG